MRRFDSFCRLPASHPQHWWACLPRRSVARTRLRFIPPGSKMGEAMDSTAFEQARREMLRRYRPGSVAGLALDCSYRLDQSPLLEVVRVKKTGEAATMLEVLCRPRTPGAAAE